MADHFSDLFAWQLAVRLRDRVHALTDAGNAKSDREFYSDIRDAAGSIPNNIAEGHSRFSPSDNRRFLSIARGSLGEVQSRLLEGRTRGFWSATEFAEVYRLSKRTAGAVAGLMRYLATDRAKRNAETIKRRLRAGDKTEEILGQQEPNEPRNP